VGVATGYGVPTSHRASGEHVVQGFITDPTAEDGLRLAVDLPEPTPAVDEVLVDVRAFGVNRGELFLLRQRDDGWRPGQDLAGVVVRAADDGTGPAEGARIVGVADGGGWSERVAVPSRHVAAIDDDVSFSQAAALPIAGLTALRALRLGGAVLGRRVLVTGATGAVGSLAVQLAAASGAVVTAHVSGPNRGQAVAEPGVDRVIWAFDDTTGPYDVVLDGVGGPVLQGAVQHLSPGGVAVTYGSMAGPAELALADFRSAPLARVVGFFHHVPEDTKGEDLAILADLVGGGRLRPQLGVTRDWARTHEVLALLRDGDVRGKAVLTL
jgi:NADPH:quinone reductase-like Zn-dependent oxidoreductase